MSKFFKHRRLTRSQRVALSAFLFTGTILMLMICIFWSARHPSHYSYESGYTEYITADMLTRIVD